MEHDNQPQGKQISITLNRDSIINTVLAIQLGVLVVFGWQLLEIKDTMGGGNLASAAGGIEIIELDEPILLGEIPTPPIPAGNGPSAPTQQDHVRGNVLATISLIEYSDLECPYCAQFHPTAQQAVDEYGGDVNWIYRHFPLSIHAGAEKKAVGSECAAKLAGNDAFWNYTDTLFANQATTVSELANIAVSAGVNASDFQDCLDSNETLADVNSDLNSGIEAGVTGTPGTFVYNNETGESKLVPGALPYSQLQSIIDSLI